MIEAEFWDYDSEDEMAAAVAGDVGFIIESAIDARGNALIALPGGSTPGAIFAEARRGQPAVEESDHHPDRRPAGRRWTMN